MEITIVGAGKMARGIGTRALAGGHRVRLVDNTRAKADALAADLGGGASGADFDALDGADIVVLAVPFEAAKSVAREHAQALAGKVVVDICNPVDFSTFDSLVTPPGEAAVSLIAAEAPRARFVKAFNTTFSTALVAGEVGGLPLDVFIATDDDAARSAVTELVSSGGLRPVDAGPLRRAQELEAFQFLHMTLQDRLGLNWSSAIKILP
ncbi:MULTISPECIES: NAD(P)-binding domain-containing protein [unclassified Streptomyces]|uniref:NADPH-dependent F420 reductase n=1 Tax=unclassified Streptomyces TaxID=2593676 RepID=UPI00344D3BBC